MPKEGLSVKAEGARILQVVLRHSSGFSSWNSNEQATFLIKIESIAYEIIADFTSNSRDEWKSVYTLIWNLPDSLSMPLANLATRLNQLFSEGMTACARDQPEIVKKFGIQLLSIIIKASLSAFEKRAGFEHF